jgi:ribosomal protein S18 acetylase RimI-like enzyme
MKNGNKTASGCCRFLSEDAFNDLYKVFTEAFSDYVFPFALTETQFRNHLNLNAVDLARSVGYVENNELIGFSLNGFGEWEGKPTVYDAGTGVVPSERRRGVSRGMFEMMIPNFRAAGFKQYLLEVVTSNAGARRLYDDLGFEKTRELALLQYDGSPKPLAPTHGAEIREIDEPDWALFQSFWDGKPSWQNTIEAVVRSAKLKRILGAFVEGRCVGYLAFSKDFGRVAQLAVDQEHRHRGIATSLIDRMHTETVTGYSVQVVNIDKALKNAIGFFRARGFYERLSQYEMMKPL